MKTKKYAFAFALSSISISLMFAGTVSAQETAVAQVSNPEKVAQGEVPKPLAETVAESKPITPSVSDTSDKTITPEPPAQPAVGDDWEFEVTPYLWAPSVSGNFRVGDTDVEVDSGGGDFVGNLKGAFAIQLEARKGKFAFLVDESYAHLGIDGTARGPLATPFTVEPTMNLFEAGLGYTLFSKQRKNADAGDRPLVSLEVIGGMRVVFLKIRLLGGAATEGLPGPGPGPGLDVEGSRTFVDAIVGNRLKFRPHPKFTVNLNYTIGGGGSKFSWGMNALGDYRFIKWLSLSGGYRVLDINSDRSENPVGVHARLAGLYFGATFHF